MKARLPHPFSTPLPCRAAQLKSRLGRIVTIEHDITAVAELNEPLVELSRHLVDRSTDLRVRGERFDTLSDRANRTSRGVAVLRCEESMEACHVAQGRRGPDYARHWSIVRRWWLHILSCFQPC